MSTRERPGLAVNEDEVERHVSETREQARRANYPEQPTPLHGRAPSPRRDAEEPRRAKDREQPSKTE